MKSVKITPPEGFEVDKENSTLGEIKFKPIQHVSLNDIVSEVGNKYTMIDVKTMSFKFLLQIAKYYNGDWEPDWNNSKELKYYIYKNNGYHIDSCMSCNSALVYFKSKEIAQEVIDNYETRRVLNKLYDE
jgi:hypothetical protein